MCVAERLFEVQTIQPYEQTQVCMAPKALMPVLKMEDWKSVSR